MTIDLDLAPFIDSTSGLIAAILAKHPEGAQIFEDARAGRTSLRLLYDQRQRHLAVAVMDERGFRPVASLDVGHGEMEFSPYADAPAAGPVH